VRPAERAAVVLMSKRGPSRRFERNPCRILTLHDAGRQKCGLPSSIVIIAAENDVRPLIHLRAIEGKDR
jgi:hypothetical protein